MNLKEGQCTHDNDIDNIFDLCLFQLLGIYEQTIIKGREYIQSANNKYTFILLYGNLWIVISTTQFIPINNKLIIIIDSHSAPMKSASKKNRQVVLGESQEQVRRSARQRKEPKNDDYFMGSSYIGDIFGPSYNQDEPSPKRGRRNYRYDDSDDYSQGHKYSKKNKQINTNKVEALLDWKLQLQALPINLNYLQEETQEVLLHQFHTAKLTKNMGSQNLAALGQDIQAIFINIDWGKKGQNMKDFQHLRIQSTKLMAKGLVFVWAPKQNLSEMLSIMKSKDFTYVQNLQIINFDIEKAKSLVRKGSTQESGQKNEELDWARLIKALENVDPCDIIADEHSSFFNSSKRTLLMFKKNSEIKFELRHQRTCDVVFDMPLRLGQKCNSDLKAYLYNMIETLLPDCLTVNQIRKNQFQFKMMELWADKGDYRRGWISVVQE